MNYEKHLEHVEKNKYAIAILEKRVRSIRRALNSASFKKINGPKDCLEYEKEAETLERAISMICDGRNIEVVLQTNYCTFR